MQNLPVSYYVDWSGLEDFSYPMDAKNLPMVDYGAPIGLKYNAITISQWGLANLQWWEKQPQEKFMQTAITSADWLVENAQPWRHNSLAWIYDFGHYLYGPMPPWISGMAQGEAVSLLLRAHQLTGNENYLQTAHAAIIPFQYVFVDGGVADHLADGLWFQEYPVHPAVHVLNGGIFALWGLYDYVQVTDDAGYADLLKQSVLTLKNHWQKWDNGFWSIYDLYKFPRLASKMYHELHIRQMLAMDKLFPENDFAQVAGRWQQQQKNPLNNFRWICGKVVEKMRVKAAGAWMC